MKWGKKTYQGTIVKIGDDEASLTKFANLANRKILSSGNETQDILDDLYKLSNNQKTQQTGKRQHVETERMKESRLQDQDSPTKKKKDTKEPKEKKDTKEPKEKKDTKEPKEKKDTKEPKEKKDKKESKEKKNENSNTLAQKKAEKKKKEEATNLVVAAEIVDLHNQFTLESDDDLQIEKEPRQNNILTTPELRLNNSLVDNPASETEVRHHHLSADNPESETELRHHNLLTDIPENHKQKVVETPDINNDRLKHLKETPLTTTWQLCQMSSEDHDSFTPQEENAPPSPVIDMFMLLLNPTVQQYMRRMVNRFGNVDQNVNQSNPVPDPIYANLDETDEYIYTAQQTGQKLKNINNQSLETSQILPQMPATTNTQLFLHIGNTYFPQAAPVLEQSILHIPEMVQPTYFPNVPVHTNILSSPSNTERYPGSLQSSPMAPQTPRRSPRKHNSLASSGSKNMTKLLADKSVLIDKDVMALSIRLSKKSAKPAYTLTMKLMPGLFTIEEMAQSKGQGLVVKKDDMRPVLDKEKISALKEYVRCWCKANSIPEPPDSEINEAITERISYARKQQKKNIEVTKQINK